MAYAVSLFFDEPTAAAVQHIWTRMAQTGVSSLLADGPYHPHLTLAIYSELDADALAADLAALANTQECFPVSLSYTGVFTGEEITVFVAATASQALMALHRRVHSLLHLHGAGPSPYYLPDRWNPHCSVARRITEEAIPRAVAVCLRMPLPLQGFAERIGVIETPEENEVAILPFRRR
jgi:2'-5' RNA ligase